MTTDRTGLENAARALRSHQKELISELTQRMRALSPAHDLADSAIVDHLPQILGQIADIVAPSHTGKPVWFGDLPKEHAVDRLQKGFDLDQLVTEYGLLRRSILELWESRVGSTIDLAELRKLDIAVDEAITMAAVRYAEARERLLKAVDRISETALGPGDLDTFLKDLLTATLESMDSVDTAVVLLRDGDLLRVHAAVGLEGHVDAKFSIARSEGFAGHVAAARRPVFIRDAASDPRVISPPIREAGVRALYGVPLIRNDKVFGVAHIGSVKATEFSEEDKLLFRTMVSRASSIVVKTQLLDDLRRAETAQRFLSEASKQLAESLDYESTLVKIARLAVPTIADWCVVDLLQDGTVRRVSVAHADHTKEKFVYELAERYPLDLNAPTGTSAAAGIPNVLRTGRSVLVSKVTDTELTAVARGSEHAHILRELGLKAYIVVPILLRQQVLGAITLATAESESNRRYSKDDLRVAEDLAGRTATTIENARLYAEARQAVAVREQVLAIVSHDLRNQLGVIATGAALLARKADGVAIGAEVRKPIDTIRRTTTGMQHLLGDLLDMASIQAGRLAVEPAVTDVWPILEEAFETHEPLARTKGLHLDVKRAPSAVAVRADRKRILQVLGNLLGNAIKFSHRGGMIVLDAEVGEAEVTVRVTDTGPGIDRNEIENIFEPYRAGRRDAGSGTGLGLYIVKGVVQRHGGRIWVESERGRGSTFFFTLPRV